MQSPHCVRALQVQRSQVDHQVIMSGARFARGMLTFDGSIQIRVPPLPGAGEYSRYRFGNVTECKESAKE